MPQSCRILFTKCFFLCIGVYFCACSQNQVFIAGDHHKNRRVNFKNPLYFRVTYVHVREFLFLLFLFFLHEDKSQRA